MTFTTDHFWCYVTIGSPVDETVFLEDQFDGGEQVVVWGTARFCNPVGVENRFTGVYTDYENPESHLNFFGIFSLNGSVLPPTRTVVVNNQFGEKKITVFQGEALAVPTNEQSRAPHHDLDHFKCYRAYGANVNRYLDLDDQFQSVENVKVLYPFLFCALTEKMHETGATTPIIHPEDHLVCYKLTRKPLQPFTASVITFHQFGGDPLTVRNPDLLCVPSKKLKVALR